MLNDRWDALTHLLVEGGMDPGFALQVSSLLDTHGRPGARADDFARALLAVALQREARAAWNLAQNLRSLLADKRFLAASADPVEWGPVPWTGPSNN